MTTYNLPNVDALVGTIKIKLYANEAGLTVPTIQTVIDIGDIVETADIEVGVTQIGTLKMSLRDDHSTYNEGFWYRVLADNTLQIRFLLNEGGSDKFLFFGKAQGENIHWTEHYLGSNKIRTCTLTLVSVASLALETDVADWLDAAYTNRQATGYTNPTNIYEAISINGFFSALLSGSGLNASYDATDCAFVFDVSLQDIKWKIGVSSFTPNQLYVAVTYTTGTPTKTDYFNSSAGNYLAKHYAKAHELVAALAKNFGIIIRFDYDVATERHLIRLAQRGRAYANSENLSFGSREKQSQLRKSFDLLGDAVRCSFLLDTTKFVWFSRKYITGSFLETDPADWVKFDIDFRVPFIVDASASAGATYALYAGGAVTTVVALNAIQYWRYDTDAYVTATAGGVNLFLEAAAGYLYYRFTNSFAEIVRRYSDIVADDGSGDSFRNLTVMRRTSIDDGNGAKNYYANIVKKILSQSESEIVWIEE